MQNSSSMSVPAEKSIIRRASGLLSTIASPFANHRASFLLDTSEPSEDSEEIARWAARGRHARSISSHAQILVETVREVHTQSSPRKDLRIITSQSTMMTGSHSKAGAQSLLKPHSYHYQKTSSSANSSSQGYTVASQRLCSVSRSMEQLIIGDDIKQITDSPDFQAAFASQFYLSPILDEPNSPESESDEKFLFSPTQRSQSLKPYAGSSQMQRSIETTSSIGYNLHSPVEHCKAPQEKRLSKEDYSAWIRFENPIDLLSPVSTYSSSSEQDQGPLEAYSMAREETQSYLGDSPIEATFSMHAQADLISSSQNFGALSSSALLLPSPNGNHISPSLQVPKAENHHGSNHKSLRKKISQSLKDAFGIPAHNA